MIFRFIGKGIQLFVFFLLICRDANGLYSFYFILLYNLESSIEDKLCRRLCDKLKNKETIKKTEENSFKACAGARFFFIYFLEAAIFTAKTVCFIV